MLRSGNAYAGIAATTSTTKGGEDEINSQSERDSLFNTDDESQESESDTNSEAHHSEDHKSDEDATSNSTTNSEMEYDEEPFNDVINCDFPDVKISDGVSKLRLEVRNASPAIRSEVLRLRKENKELRGHICNSRMKCNQSKKFYLTHLRKYRDREKGSHAHQELFEKMIIEARVESMLLRKDQDYLQQALQDKSSLIQQKEQELEQARGAHREITKELDEVQQALEDLRKLQVTKGREEYKSIQDPSAMQELQLSKITRDLRKELEMDQLRDSIRKLNEDYKSIQESGATRELQQSKTAHESGGEELKQLRIILEKLASDHEKLREAVQGDPSRSKDTVKQVGPPAESRVDNNKDKGSRSNHFAMRAVVQDKQGSALDRIHSAARKNVARQVKIKASGREFILSPRRQIYVGNIAFNATEEDVMEAINDLTNNTVDTCTMPRSGDRNRGYAFVTIVWPSEFKHEGVDMDTFCDAIHHLDIKGRPIYAKEAHHREK